MEALRAALEGAREEGTRTETALLECQDMLADMQSHAEAQQAAAAQAQAQAQARPPASCRAADSLPSGLFSGFGKADSLWPHAHHCCHDIFRVLLQAAAQAAEQARAAAVEAEEREREAQGHAAALSRRVTQDGAVLEARAQSLEAAALQQQRLQVKLL